MEPLGAEQLVADAALERVLLRGGDLADGAGGARRPASGRRAPAAAARLPAQALAVLLALLRACLRIRGRLS